VTRQRRRVVRLVLKLKLAGVEPVLVGSTYLDVEAALAEQWAGITPSRRKTVRRLAQRSIAEAGSLAAAGDHLVPASFQQGSLGSETARCAVCLSRFGKNKRRFPSEAAAQLFCAEQRDPGLVVYACVAGQGWHLGHPSPTSQRREWHRIHEHEAQMQTTSPQKKISLAMQATLGHPVLILIYSASLLLIGGGVGRLWIHTPALLLCCAGAVLLVVYDAATSVLFLWLTANWVRSINLHRDDDR